MPVRLVLLPAVAAAAALAGAAWAGAASAPPPSPTSFLLAARDFGPRAKSADVKPLKVGVLTEYVRAFSNGLVAGNHAVASAASLALVAPDPDVADEAYQEIETASHTAAGRRALARDFATGFASKLSRKLHVVRTTVGTPRYETDTIVLPIVIKMNVGTVRMPLVLTHVESVLGAFVLTASSGRSVPAAAVDFETAALRKHLTDAFTVANSALPTITGSPAQGQALTVDEGGWSGAPTSYTYAWSRCVNGTCTPIDGATASTYVVTPDDSGSTLQVAVTGGNTVGSATATAAPTGVVQ
jgi:hypothetical protein